MKPALSIIFFTVASGAGLGLLALLALTDLCPAPLLSPEALARGIALALLLVAAGLASSLLHLANPSNAWRAFARFRTSWLSREAVVAALLFPVAFAYLIAVWSGSAGTADGGSSRRPGSARSAIRRPRLQSRTRGSRR